MTELSPDQVAVLGTMVETAGKAESLMPKPLDHGTGGASPGKRGKHEPHGILNLLVRIEHEAALGVVYQADGGWQTEVTAARLVADASLQPGAEDMELGFGHRAFEPQAEPIVKVGWIIEAVLVQNERLCQRTEFEQPVPIRRIACQAGAFQAHHNADTVSANLGHELLKPCTVPLGSRLAQIAIDHADLLGCPPECQRLVA